MTQEQKDRLAELLKIKKSGKRLSRDEFDEFRKLSKMSAGGGTHEGREFKPGNDFSWWAKEPELLKNSANLKPNYVAGTSVAGSDLPYVMPGVLQVGLNPAYGADSHATDPINIWARDLFLRMFQKYRGISAYTAADLGIALIAAVECIKTIATYERIYGVINRYSRLNINMPTVEESALGLTSAQADYLRGHLSDFRYDLNLLLKKAQRLCVPKDLSIVADSISLFGYEYLDHESRRSQIIVFTQNLYGVYEDTAVSTGGSIVFNELALDLFDFNADNMCKALSAQVNALMGSDSVQKIFGDLVVWFSDDQLLTMAYVPDDYVVLPMKSESILHKLHNLECINTYNANALKPTSIIARSMSTSDQTYVGNGLYHIYQFDDRIVTTQSYIYNIAATPVQIDSEFDSLTNAITPPACVGRCHIIDTYRVEATEESVVEGALLKFQGQRFSDGTNSALVVVSAGFHIATELTLWTKAVGGASSNALRNITSAVPALEGVAARLAIIDWAPLVYYIPGGSIVTDVLGDLDNIIPVYPADLARILRTIVLSGIKTDISVVNK